MKAFKITSLHRAVEYFLHSNCTRQVKEPKFACISCPGLFLVTQSGLNLDVSDILGPSKSIMGTGIWTQFLVCPMWDVSYNGISSGKELPLEGTVCVFWTCSWIAGFFLWSLQNSRGTTKLSHDSSLHMAVIRDSEEYLLRCWCGKDHLGSLPTCRQDITEKFEHLETLELQACWAPHLLLYNKIHNQTI